jgi:monoamine oxidase
MYDTLIIGGGITGIYCAMSLNKDNVLLLEQSDYWGGRIKTHYHPQYEIGAGRFHRNHKILWKLIQRFQFTPVALPGNVEYVDEKEGRIPQVDDYMSLLIHKMKLTESMRSKTFFEYCVETLGEEDALQFVHVFGFHEPYYKNAYDFLHSLKMDFLGNFYVLKEGLSALCERMLKEFQGERRLNHRVSTIQRVGNHLEVDGIKTKRVIVTIPPSFFKNFPILSPYTPVVNQITQGPLLRIYAKYPTPVWFESLPKMTTSQVLRHIIPIHDGIIMIAYVEDIDLRPFLKDSKLQPLTEIQKTIQSSLATLFPTMTIPDPLWVRPYLWNIGTHAWLPGPSSKLLKQLPEIDQVYVCGEAFSVRQAWIEGSLESAERVLEKLKHNGI